LKEKKPSTIMQNRVLCVFVLSLFVVGVVSSLSIPSTVLIERSEEDVHNEFSCFKSVHTKRYGSKDEEAYRKQIFRNNLATIDAHNARPDRKFDMGINQFSDFTKEEFKQLQTFRLPHSPIQRIPAFGTTRPTGNIRGSWPDSVNWVTAGRVGEVRDQEQCGSCWAFAAIATMESAKAIQENTTVVENLSEQMLVDCDTFDNGCGGGMYDQAFEYLKQKNIGAMKESEYSYVGQEQTCKYDVCSCLCPCPCLFLLSPCTSIDVCMIVCVLFV
jgi:hypothetical protein